MTVGPPVSIEIEPCENGEIAVSLYDAKGFCCGGASFYPDGSIAATLIAGDNELISSDLYKPKETIE